MKGAYIYVLLFFGLWLLLSAQIEPFYLCAGIICSVFSLKIFGVLNKNHQNILSFSPRFILYFLWLLKEIFISAIKVTFMVWSPNLQIAPQMKFINTKLKTRAKKILFASSITLTPGTITIDLKNDALLVHALDKNSFADLDQGVMEGRIKAL